MQAEPREPKSSNDWQETLQTYLSEVKPVQQQVWRTAKALEDAHRKGPSDPYYALEALRQCGELTRMTLPRFADLDRWQQHWDTQARDADLRYKSRLDDAVRKLTEELRHTTGEPWSLRVEGEYPRYQIQPLRVVVNAPSHRVSSFAEEAGGGGSGGT